MKRPEEDSPSCGGRGALECGRCVCDAQYTGGRCQRRRWSLVPAPGDERCREGPDTLVCGGRGTCEEGFCNCDALDDPAQRYTGHYCECNDFDCPKSNNRYGNAPLEGCLLSFDPELAKSHFNMLTMRYCSAR